MTSAPITIDVVPVEDCVVVAVAGEVDLLTADQLRGSLMTVVERYPVVVVDLAEVQFLSSTGLAALTLAHRVAVASGNQLRLVATDRVTLRPLEITGMTTQIAVFDSTDDAMAGGDRPDPSSPRD